MPFYHAGEATEAVKGVLGEYYLRDDRWLFGALWSDWVACRVVAPDREGEGVLWYRPGVVKEKEVWHE